ncbi:MAG: glycosyltransferase family 2 protein, partial [Candidatus Omnitrophica bacterium]|nr:glycosyltransferase family 2 protein [Candidatus Omnitrophota bacterium]
MSEPRTSIVILNWNQKDDTAKCLKSLEKLLYKNYGIIVVDNGSKDGSPDFLKNNFSNITLIKNEENLGFAEGSNIGIRHALSVGTDYVLLLNNDLVVQEDFLGILVEAAEKDSKIGILGAVNYS